MESRTTGAATRYLSALFEVGTAAGLGDRVLLERFADRRGDDDEAAELAFAAIVERHGPMVLRVCRAVLGDRHEAEDAFQATFLVLAGRARSIRRGDSVGSWLHGVALRVAGAARRRASRRRHHERRHAEMSATTGADPNAGARPVDDVEGVLHQEIARLPEKYGKPVVLCYLEGLTHDQAADRLGWPVGTVRRRLAGARDRLRARLTRRGLSPSLLPAWESARAMIPVPSRLAEATVRGALRVGSGKAAMAGIVSAEALALMKGVSQTMTTTKRIAMTAAVLTAGLVTTGVGLLADPGQQPGNRMSLTTAKGGSEPDTDREGGEPSKALRSRGRPDAGRQALNDRLGAISRGFERRIGSDEPILSRDEERVALYPIYHYDTIPRSVPGANVGLWKMPASRETRPLRGILVAGIPLRDRKGTLLVAIATDELRGQAPPAIYHDVAISPRLPARSRVLEIRPGGARLLDPLEREQVPGGTRISLPVLDRTTMILCTTDKALEDRIRAAVGCGGAGGDGG